MLNPENSSDDIWSDTAFAGTKFHELNERAVYEQNSHEKGSRLYPFEESIHQENKTRSKVKTEVGYGFGGMLTWKKVEYAILI